MAVLVTYASARGSTKTIAERIGERLKAHGFDVAVRPTDDPGDVGSYEAVVAGSAVHSGKWLPSAREFVGRHRHTLGERPVWLFSVSSVGDRESFFPGWAASVLRKAGAEPKEIGRMRTTLRAREHRNFAGVIRRGDWGLVGDVFLKALGGRHGDHRNWPEIEAWADAIGRELGSRGEAARD